MSTIKQEQRILSALITNLTAAGYQPAAVYIEDGYVMPVTVEGAPEEVGKPPDHIARPMTEAEVLAVFKDYDLYAPTVHFTDQHLTTWGGRGVMVVPGNGSDFISDWHCGDKAFNAIVETIGDAAYNEVYS